MSSTYLNGMHLSSCQSSPGMSVLPDLQERFRTTGKNEVEWSEINSGRDVELLYGCVYVRSKIFSKVPFVVSSEMRYATFRPGPGTPSSEAQYSAVRCMALSRPFVTFYELMECQKTKWPTSGSNVGIYT